MNDHPLRLWRKKNNVKLVDLAKLAKTTPSSISRIERGAQDPSLALIARIINATNKEVQMSLFLDAYMECTKNDTP
jgi:transcriptional regulator with XRE-family HTH domain